MSSLASPDVAVLGAGAIGLLSALRLRQAGLSVALVERGEPGGEASWAAAGILGAQMEAQGPGPMLDLALRSRALHPGLAQELLSLSGIDVQQLSCGVLKLAFDAAEARVLEESRAWQQVAGLRAERLDGQGVRALGGPAEALSGLWLAADGQVDNRLLCEALRIACERTGVQLVRGEATRLVSESGRVSSVELRVGERVQTISTRRAVLALGSWSALLEGIPRPLAADSVRPVRGQMVVLRPARLPFTCVMGDPAGYAVPRSDGRVLVGATVEDKGFEKRVTAQGLLQLLASAGRLSPALAEAAVIDQWAGLRPAARDLLPRLGAHAALEGLVVATAHYRSGILLCPITADVVSDLVLGRSPRVELSAFDPLRQ